MHLLLPPSETKRDGGIPGTSLDLGAISFAELTRARRTALAGLRSVSKTLAGSMSALKLGPTQRFEIDRNRAISTSAAMPALERYTGVLYDALDASTLDAAARDFAGRTVIIHSALFGVIGADDLVPAYRFSHDSRIPGVSLPKLWRDANAAALGHLDGLVVDLRSESYVHLGPAPEGSLFLRVVTPGEGGALRALNHFNKHGKGEFVRAIALSGRDFETVDDLLEWAEAAGVQLRRGGPGELELVV